MVGSELAEQATRDHRDSMLTDAPRRHALMPAFDDDADSFRIQYVLNTVRDLGCHRFLDL